MPAPEQSRRRARLRGGAILAALAVVSYGPTVFDVYHHRGPGGTAIGFAALGSLVIALLPQLMANSDSPARQLDGARGNLLAARTMTGWRTLDRTRIRRVHYTSMTSRTGLTSHEYVVVTDDSGSRIGFTLYDEPTVKALHDALVAGAPGGVRVSYNARAVLGIDRPHSHGFVDCGNGHPTLYSLAIWAALMFTYGAILALVVM